jgi:1,4-alpha-glucan branching enzyme
VDSDEELMERVSATLRRPVSTGADGIERALQQLRREARRRRWFRVSAVAGIAAAVVLAVGLTRRSGSGSEVRFELADPTQGPVALIGDFNDWNPQANPLGHGDGQWSTTIRLKPGRYRYAFVVGGSNWRSDPRSPAADDDFGTPTSVITVTN